MTDEKKGFGDFAIVKLGECCGGDKSAPKHQADFPQAAIQFAVDIVAQDSVFPSGVVRQTSLWIRSATIARPSTGFFHVKASGIDSFLCAMNAFNPSSTPGSRSGG